MNCYQINSFEEYIRLLGNLTNGKKLWFRGQSKAKYRLIPGVLRDAVAVKDGRGNEIKPVKANFSNGKSEHVYFPDYWRMLEEYKNEVSPIIDFKPQNDLSWLCFAQHYGLPTPLLDWTTDPLVALFFAISNIDEAELNDSEMGEVNFEDEECLAHLRQIEFKSNSAAVFVIDPLHINESCLNNNGNPKILDINKDEELIYSYMDNYISLPFCIYGEKNDKRMCRQSGNFTVHCRLTWPIDYTEFYRKSMSKIIIPYKIVKKLKRTLEVLDLTNDSIYMGRDEKDEKASSITKVIIEEFKSEFKDVFI